MAEVDLGLLDGLLAITAPRPWVWERPGLAVRASVYSAGQLLAKTACEDGGDDATAYLIVTAINNLEHLLDEVRQLREHNQRLRESLKEMLNQYADEGFELGWVKRMHDAARAALAGEAAQDVPHV